MLWHESACLMRHAVSLLAMLTPPPPRSVLFDSEARVMLEWEGGANFVFQTKASG